MYPANCNFNNINVAQFTIITKLQLIHFLNNNTICIFGFIVDKITLLLIIKYYFIL
jgi:hypothetical protein